MQEKSLATERAFFDFDVVVIRPERFEFGAGDYHLCRSIQAIASAKSLKPEPWTLVNGGIGYVLLDIPYTYSVTSGAYSTRIRYSVSNYQFLQGDFGSCLQGGTGEQITYTDPGEAFAAPETEHCGMDGILHRRTPPAPFHEMRFFATVGVGTGVAGKMPYLQGHLIVLPNLKRLDEPMFFEACEEYLHNRQESAPPIWMKVCTCRAFLRFKVELQFLTNRFQIFVLARDQETQNQD